MFDKVYNVFTGNLDYVRGDNKAAFNIARFTAQANQTEFFLNFGMTTNNTVILVNGDPVYSANYWSIENRYKLTFTNPRALNDEIIIISGNINVTQFFATAAQTEKELSTYLSTNYIVFVNGDPLPKTGITGSGTKTATFVQALSQNDFVTILSVQQGTYTNYFTSVAGQTEFPISSLLNTDNLIFQAGDPIAANAYTGERTNKPLLNIAPPENSQIIILS